MPALIKWGILGLGKIAHKFASDLILVEDCELTAVASSNEDRAKVFAKEFGVNTFYGDYESLYADNSVKIIYIASLNQNHQVSYEPKLHYRAWLCSSLLPFAEYFS